MASLSCKTDTRGPLKGLQKGCGPSGIKYVYVALFLLESGIHGHWWTKHNHLPIALKILSYRPYQIRPTMGVRRIMLNTQLIMAICRVDMMNKTVRVYIWCNFIPARSRFCEQTGRRREHLQELLLHDHHRQERWIYESIALPLGRTPRCGFCFPESHFSSLLVSLPSSSPPAPFSLYSPPSFFSLFLLPLCAHVREIVDGLVLSLEPSSRRTFYL